MAQELVQPQSPTATHQAATWNVLGPAERKMLGTQHCGAKENWNSPLQRLTGLVFPVSILRVTCFQPLLGFWSLSLLASLLEMGLA